MKKSSISSTKRFKLLGLFLVYRQCLARLCNCGLTDFFQGKLKEVTAKAKFRTLIRRVVENKWWFKKITDELKEYEKLKLGAGPERITSFLDFDPDLISIKDKLVLMSNPAKRSQEDVKKITERLSYMLPFLRYSTDMTQELLTHGSLKGFKTGRVLFKAKDEALFAYFILSGIVEAVPYQSDDPVLEFNKRVIKDPEIVKSTLSGQNQILEQGNMIGRKEILFGERRGRNAVIKHDLLCIRFSRKRMLDTLEPLLSRWSEIAGYLVNFRILEHFDIGILRELSKMGKIKKLRAKKLVNTQDTSSFLVEGAVTVIQRLLVEKYKWNGKESYRLFNDQDALVYGGGVESIYMQVCVLTNGAYFGLGERMSKYIFWTAKLCKLVQFPTSELLGYGEKGIWDGARIILDQMYPTDKELFKIFLYGRQKLAYKKEITDQCPKSKRPTTIHNVPVSVRSKHMKVKRSFMERVGMLNMEDYLKGGLSPLDHEISYNFVLDSKGAKRENFFGRFWKDPNVKKKTPPVLDDEEKVIQDTYPFFFFCKGNSQADS